jgi:flagellar hook protein FlgE
MFSGVSALNAESQALGTIADNIANVNTVGYKDTAARFSTLVTQQSTSNSYSPGGVIFNRQSNIDQQGLLQSSGSATDVAISGNGMFVVNGGATPGANDPYLFTRAGSFAPDENGNLKNTAGYYLQGWRTDTNGVPIPINLSALTSLETVNVSGVSGSASATTEVEVGLNLPASEPIGAAHQSNLQVFDSLGVAHDIALTWTKSDLNEWDLSATPPTGAASLNLRDANGNVYYSSGQLQFTGQPSDGDTIVIGGTTYEFDSNASATGTPVAIGADLATTLTNLITAVGDARFTFDGTDTVNIAQSSAGAALTVDATNTSVLVQSNNGSFTVSATAAATPAVTFSGNGTPSTFNVASVAVSGWPTGALDSTIDINFGTLGLTDGVTQFSGDYNVTFINQNGVQAGTFSGVSISEEGLVIALFDNGETLPIYQLPVATFPNVNGLISRSGNVYIGSESSGSPVLRFAKSGSAGAIASGALENSTVDLGTEFTNMIIAQRAYSATSRVITTADEMLDDLVRIKR